MPAGLRAGSGHRVNDALGPPGWSRKGEARTARVSHGGGNSDPPGPTNFLNRVCSRTDPGNDQLNEPEAQGFYVTTGIPPKATLRGHLPPKGRHPQKYKGICRSVGGVELQKTVLKARRRESPGQTGCVAAGVSFANEFANAWRVFA